MCELIELKKSLHKDKRVFETALKCDEKAANKYLLGIYNTIVNNDKLQNCDIESIKNAAITSATLGVPVDANNYAYLIPYGNKVQLQMSYKGYVYVAKQDKDVDNISAVLVYPDDKFSVDLGNNSISHIPNLESGSYGDEELIRFVYAVVRFRQSTGRSQMFEVLTKKQVDEIRAGSKAGGEKDKWGKPTIWQKHYGEMARKTAIKRLCKHAQLGNVAVADQVDNAVHENKIINVTPEGELLVDDPDTKLKNIIIEAVNSSSSTQELNDVQVKYQDDVQDLSLYNVAASKEVMKAMGKAADSLYIEDVTGCLEGCDDIESIDKVYSAHEPRINRLKATERNGVIEAYVNLKQHFIDAA
jgi:phage RecT family recombinase